LGELGNIFDHSPSSKVGARGPKGPDLRITAPIPVGMLASGEEVLITVPDGVPHQGGTVPRHRGPHDPPGEVRLHLSPQLKDGVTLRLRGQGGEHPSSRVPGDLLVTLELVADPGGVRWTWVAVLVAVVAVGAVAWSNFGAG
jgi:hypothetical protein